MPWYKTQIKQDRGETGLHENDRTSTDHVSAHQHRKVRTMPCPQQQIRTRILARKLPRTRYQSRQSSRQFRNPQIHKFRGRSRRDRFGQTKHLILVPAATIQKSPKYQRAILIHFSIHGKTMSQSHACFTEQSGRSAAEPQHRREAHPSESLTPGLTNTNSALKT
jgi:hypothetical protein